MNDWNLNLKENFTKNLLFHLSGIEVSSLSYFWLDSLDSPCVTLNIKHPSTGIYLHPIIICTQSLITPVSIAPYYMLTDLLQTQYIYLKSNIATNVCIYWMCLVTGNICWDIIWFVLWIWRINCNKGGFSSYCVWQIIELWK